MKMSRPQTVKLLGREFVLIPKRDYDRLRAKVEQARQDEGDVAESKRRGKERSISVTALRSRLGL